MKSGTEPQYIRKVNGIKLELGVGSLDPAHSASAPWDLNILFFPNDSL